MKELDAISSVGIGLVLLFLTSAPDPSVLRITDGKCHFRVMIW